MQKQETTSAADEILLSKEERSNAKGCLIFHCCFALVRCIVLLSPAGMCFPDFCEAIIRLMTDTVWYKNM